MYAKIRGTLRVYLYSGLKNMLGSIWGSLMKLTKSEFMLGFGGRGARGGDG